MGILSGRDSRNSGKCLTESLGYSQEETQETQVLVSCRLSHRHTGILSGRDSRNSGMCFTNTLGYSQKETQETKVKVSQILWDILRKRLNYLRLEFHR